LKRKIDDQRGELQWIAGIAEVKMTKFHMVMAGDDRFKILGKKHFQVRVYK
jgi:hypothetical protein